GGEELAEPREHPDVHGSGHGPRHQVRGAGGGHHVRHVPDEEGGGARDHEAAVAAAHLLEGGAALYFEVHVRVGTGLPAGLRGGHRGASATGGLAPARGELVVPGVGVLQVAGLAGRCLAGSAGGTDGTAMTTPGDAWAVVVVLHAHGW